MTRLAQLMEKAIVASLSPRRDPLRADAMSAYMKHRFPFLGISAPERRRLVGVALSGLPRPEEDDLIDLARACWSHPEREFQYAAIDLFRKASNRLSGEVLSEARWMIVNKPWWDSCDPLATTVVGGIAKRFPASSEMMETWIRDPDMWLRRAALLHQLKWKQACDQDRLFRFCLLTMEETEFFIRKAIGWALRQHARVAPEEVSRFLLENRSRMSELSFREAAKHLPLD